MCVSCRLPGAVPNLYFCVMFPNINVCPLYYTIQVIEEGSPEIRVLECVPQSSEGISKAGLESALGADVVKVKRRGPRL